MEYVNSVDNSINGLMDYVQNPNSSFAQTITDLQSGQFSLSFTGGRQLEDLIAGVLIAVGVLMVFFGCRLFKATLFLFVFAGAAAITFYVGAKEKIDSKVLLAASLLTGLFCGLLVIKVYKLGLFAIGAAVGFVLWFVTKSLYPQYFVDPTTMYAALIVTCFILGILSVYMEQYYLLLATPILGSFMLAQGVDHFANLDINVFGTLSGDAYCTTDQCYGLWLGVAGLALLGMIVQYRYTSSLASNRPRTKTIYKEKYVQMPEPSPSKKRVTAV